MRPNRNQNQHHRSERTQERSNRHNQFTSNYGNPNPKCRNESLDREENENFSSNYFNPSNRESYGPRSYEDTMNESRFGHAAYPIFHNSRESEYTSRSPDLRFARQTGEHYGKTPKGYSRSDERIREEICEHLMGQGSFDPSDAEIEVKEGTVTLSGTVDSRQTKFEIETAAEQCLGVQDVENKLRIKNNSSASTSQKSSSIKTRSNEDEKEKTPDINSYLRWTPKTGQENWIYKVRKKGLLAG